MKYMLKVILFILCISFQSCITTKGKDGKDGKDGKEFSENTELDLKAEGFSKGTLSANRSEGCPYILTVEKYADKLDPINIQDFFKDEIPSQVWVKYSDLRMQSRCNEARPVSIQEINKRAD